MEWFPFQVIMLHAADNIQCPAEHLKYLFKAFSILNISIIYNDTIANKYVQKAVGIMCINCGESIGFFLDNQIIENFITPFVTNIVFQNVGLSWIIQPNKNLNLGFQKY